MGNAKVWLFRALIVIGLAMLVGTWLSSWWSMDISRLGNSVVNIYPTGLQHKLTPEYFVLAHGAADMPAWFTPFAWCFLAALVVGLVLSMWLKGIWGRLLLAAVGFGQFCTPIGMLIVAGLKLTSAGMPLQGDSYYTAGGYYETAISTSLQPAWFVALGVGVYIMLLALLRERIIGKPKSAAPKPVEKAAAAGTGG